MANRYVYSGAAGTATGADWTNAHTTLSAAITASTAGDVFYVASDHSESAGAALTLTFKGTVTAPDRIISVSRAGSVPPVAADEVSGAAVATGGAGFSLGLNGSFYAQGISWTAGTGSTSSSITTTNAVNSRQYFRSCNFNIPCTSLTARVNVNNGHVIFENPTFSFGSVSQAISLGGARCSIFGKSGSVLVSGATIPTSLILNFSTGTLTVSGCDLSMSGSGKNLVGSLANGACVVRFVNCKLGASVALSASQQSASLVEMIACHTSGNVERNERATFQGTLTTETTVVRTSGGSDGVTPYSWKVVSTADAKRDFPFETFEGYFWNDTTGSAKTLTAHVVTDNVTLTDAEIWVEAEYLGSSGTPVTTLITDAAATSLTTGANQASDSGTAWTTTGLTTPIKQSLDVTFTPQMAGLVRWRVKVAKASTTVYIDTKPDFV